MEATSGAVTEVMTEQPTTIVQRRIVSSPWHYKHNIESVWRVLVGLQSVCCIMFFSCVCMLCVVSFDLVAVMCFYIDLFFWRFIMVSICPRIDLFRWCPFGFGG